MENILEKKEELLRLNKKKIELEEQISELMDYLTGPGMPGIEGTLLDRSGFPKAGLDFISIKTARHELICKENDLKHLMEIIERKMMAYFGDLSNNKNENNSKEDEERKEYSNENEERNTETFSEEQKLHNTKIDLKESFAKIVKIEKGSPADEAGLMIGDEILTFNKILYKGVSHDPLIILSEIAKNKIGEQIPISLVRKNNENNLVFLNINIVPHIWNGRGILGCEFQIL